MHSEKKWNHDRKKLLIEIRLKYEPDFVAKKKKRNTLWEQIMRDVKEIDNTFPFSKDESTRCFVNIMGTYKRIKKRNNTSGEGATNWEFFQTLDEVFGSRSSVLVPDAMLESSLESLLREDLSNDPPDSPTVLDSDATLPSTSTPRNKLKRKSNVLDFLNKESEEDAKVMKKVLDMEAEKLAVEKEKLVELKQIRTLFQKILDKS